MVSFSARFDVWRVSARQSFLPFHLREAFLCAPAIPLLLWLGFATGHAISGAVAAGAAFSVGFGAVRELRGRRWAAMAAAAGLMSLAAFAGSLAGQWTWGLILTAAVAAGLCAWLALFEETFWWITLQAAIALLVAGYYPGPPEEAANRALTVLGGGAVQMALVSVLRLVIPPLPPLGAPRPKAPPNPGLTRSHIVRATLAVGACAALAHGLGLANFYWAPMTALLILKPGLSETRARGLRRLGGTIAGCLIGPAVAFSLHESRPAMLAAIGLTCGLAYALQKASYAAFTVAVTATMVLLLSLVGGPAAATAEHRLIATVLGGAVALVAAMLTYQPRPAATPAVDRIAD